MTTEEAMNLVKLICAAYRGTLEEHVRIQDAIKALEAALVTEGGDSSQDDE